MGEQGRGVAIPSQEGFGLVSSFQFGFCRCVSDNEEWDGNQWRTFCAVLFMCFLAQEEAYFVRFDQRIFCCVVFDQYIMLHYSHSSMAHHAMHYGNKSIPSFEFHILLNKVFV